MGSSSSISSASNSSASVSTILKPFLDKSRQIRYDDSTVIERGAIIGYPLEGNETFTHWGIHIGNGFVLSKYDDSKIHRHRLGEGLWTHFIFVVQTGHDKLADRAIEQFTIDPDSWYNSVLSNCQLWVKSLAGVVDAPCPFTAVGTAMMVIHPIAARVL